MTKKATIIINLLPEASTSTKVQIEEEIRTGANIPWCKSIEKIAIEDIETIFKNLEKQGVSANAAQALMDLYTQ